MPEILSPQEMDALLTENRVAATASASRGVSAAAGRFTAFSFDGPPVLPQATIDRISEVASRFAATLSSKLASELRRDVAVSLAGVTIVAPADAERLFTDGVQLGFERTDGTKAADLVFDNDSALALIEARLGGASGEAQPVRPLTPVESVLLARLCSASAVPAWQAISGSGEKVECRRQTAERVLGSGFVSISLTIALDERGGTANLLLPAVVASKLSAPAEQARKSTGRRIPVETLVRMPVRFLPNIPGGRISLRDLMAIRPGHVVRLDRKESDPIEVHCSGKPLFLGKLVRLEGQSMIEIAHLITNEEEKENR